LLTIILVPAGYFYTLGVAGLIRCAVVWITAFVLAAIVLWSLGVEGGFKYASDIGALFGLGAYVFSIADNIKLVERYNSGEQLRWNS